MRAHERRCAVTPADEDADRAGRRHRRQRTSETAQQPACRSGVRAAARDRPAPREGWPTSGRPGRGGCVCARCERQTAEPEACARREGRTAQPAGASRGAIRSRSGRCGREADSRARGGSGPSRARDGAEAGGLRTALDGQRTAVAAPRVAADGSTSFSSFSSFSSAVKATLRPSTGPRASRKAAGRGHVKNS